jgi:hypothetical protein
VLALETFEVVLKDTTMSRSMYVGQKREKV